MVKGAAYPGAIARQHRIHKQYESWPYPRFPRLVSVPRHHSWELNLDYLRDRCALPAAPARPRIWVAGCGTFQPYTLGLANPTAQILASDLSTASMDIARRRCLWHGLYQVEFQGVDLNDPDTWPEGPFDFIECFGVLMNLNDPAATLRALSERLSPQGILRIMVYPHFSRQRIFQIQRLARLLGLSLEDRSHPQLLRRFMLALPQDHPLRYAFATYPDSQNDEGIVDGFLHAGDHGFTAFELGQLIQDAGLQTANHIHRPWGQPQVMAQALGLQGQSQSFVLNYLDLWQELRTNFIHCLVKQDAERPLLQEAAPYRLHPLLSPWSPKTRTSQRLRLLGQGLTGMRLPSRTLAQDIHLRPGQLHALARGKGSPALQKQALDWGVLLGGKKEPCILPSHSGDEATPGMQARDSQLFVGRQTPNPLYRHLFQAFAYQVPPLAELPQQWQNWQGQAEALESPGDFGLTPAATYTAHSHEIDDWLQRQAQGGGTQMQDYTELELEDEPGCLTAVRNLLRQFPDLPKKSFSAAELRELWVLCCSHRLLFWDSRCRQDAAQEKSFPA